MALEWIAATNTHLFPDVTPGLVSYTVEDVPVDLFRHQIVVNDKFDVSLAAQVVESNAPLIFVLPQLNSSTDENNVRNALGVMLELQFGSIDFYQEYYDEYGGWTVIPYKNASPMYLPQLEVYAWQACVDIDLLLDYVPID